MMSVTATHHEVGTDPVDSREKIEALPSEAYWQERSSESAGFNQLCVRGARGNRPLSSIFIGGRKGRPFNEKQPGDPKGGSGDPPADAAAKPSVVTLARQ